MVTSEDVEVVERSTVYQGYFHIDRYRLRHRRHDGGWSDEISREIFERGHAVAVLLYDPDRDKVALVEQFRPGALAAGWSPWLIEPVAGIIEEGETAISVAHRESREEAGCEVIELVPIARYLVSPGGSSETVELFCGRVNCEHLGGIHGVASEGEDIRVLVVPADEAIAWLGEGRANNAMTLIALQWLALNRSMLRRRWLDELGLNQ
nr:NUDIX domain-containing protein [Telmatospirillum sp. J64-1]